MNDFDQLGIFFAMKKGGKCLKCSSFLFVRGCTDWVCVPLTVEKAWVTRSSQWKES